jgi:hypothetical protein
MLNLNTEKSNKQFLATQKNSSNTHLFLHPTLIPSAYSFKSFLLSLLDSQIHVFLFVKQLLFQSSYLDIHLDYLRVSSSDLTDRSFCLLRTSLFSKVDSKETNQPWHPHSKMPKNKKYQSRIVSKIGIVLGYTKRAKYKGKNTRYVYDIMIDFTGAYFANLSVLKVINDVHYLNSNWQLKCHRLDVAMDDYSRRLFPANQMIAAFLMGDNFGFQVIDDSYLDFVDNKLVGTLGIGSRYSELFIRIYSKHRLFVRWETELKRQKAQRLFANLSNLGNNKGSDELPIKDFLKTLVDAAFDKLDFRDTSCSVCPKNATRARTFQLAFWSNFLAHVSSLIQCNFELQRQYNRS